MKPKFYRCEICGRIVGIIQDSASTLVCCGQPMKELIPNVKEASLEKHIPALKLDGNRLIVSVGSIEHPMLPEHYIQWICVADSKGRTQRQQLSPGVKPMAVFDVSAENGPFEVYEYCNLHGLWKAVL